MKLGALLLCIAACGQSSGPPLRVYLDEQSMPDGMDVTAAEATLAHAVAFWAACGFDIGLGDEEPVRFVAEPEWDHADWLAATMAGQWVEIRPTVPFALDDGQECVGKYYLGDILRHELGHLVGLGHDPEPTSVMYGEARPCVNRYEADACSRNDASRSSGQGSIGMQP